MPRKNTRLPAEHVAKMRRIAATKNTSVSAIGRQALQRFADGENTPELSRSEQIEFFADEATLLRAEQRALREYGRPLGDLLGLIVTHEIDRL